MLNSFWGKFGQRDDLSTTEFIFDPKKYFNLLRAIDRNVTDIHIASDRCVMVNHAPEEEFNMGNSNSNVVIAAFTTSYARLRLLKMLRKLDDRVLCYDTDSVIYVR